MSENQKTRVLYVDKASKVAISPFVSKVTLLSDELGESMVLVMPTASLLNLTNSLILSLSAEDVSRNFEESHLKINEKLKDICEKKDRFIDS